MLEHAYNLQEETKNDKTIPGTNQRVRTVVNQERQCDKFIEWDQGFSPKEHTEMQNSELEKQYQEKLRDKEHEFKEKLSACNDYALKDLDKSQGKCDFKFLVLGAIIASMFAVI